MSKTLFDELKPTLISMGMAFYGGDEAIIPIDPEKAILAAIPLFFEDRKAFRMLLTWCEKVSPFIHMERLASFSEDLNQRDRVILGAISCKLARIADRRWGLIERRVREQIQTDGLSPSLRPPDGYDSEWLIHKYGEDPDFSAWDVRIAGLEPEDSKKILTLEAILKRQQWLKIRALIGPNFRADLVYFIGTKQVKNPNQAAKLMNCSRETAYRLWREVQLYPEIQKLVA